MLHTQQMKTLLYDSMTALMWIFFLYVCFGRARCDSLHTMINLYYLLLSLIQTLIAHSKLKVPQLRSTALFFLALI